MTNTELCQMYLHDEYIFPDGTIRVLRVYSGWIYMMWDNVRQEWKSGTFVPQVVY